MKLVNRALTVAVAGSLVMTGLTATPAIASEGLIPPDAIAAVNAATDSNLRADSSLRPIESSNRNASLRVVSPTGTELSISVDENSVSKVESSEDGKLRVISTNKSHKYVAESSNEAPGAMYVVLEKPTSQKSHRFAITVGNKPAVLTELEGGRIGVSSQNGEFQNIINPAWAVDADGTSVPTEYSVVGSVLVQTVHLSGAEVYPVVADPALACDWVFCTVELNRSDTRAIAFYGALGTLIAGICAPLIPAAGWPAAACAAYLAGMAIWIQATAADAYDQGKCLGIRAFIYSPSITMHPVVYGPGGNCR